MREEIQMRKISFFAVAAVLILIGIGVDVGVSTGTTTRALADSSGIDPSALASGKNLPTSHYEDYSLVFPAVIGQ
jgi:hypothetical protein